MGAGSGLCWGKTGLSNEARTAKHRGVLQKLAVEVVGGQPRHPTIGLATAVEERRAIPNGMASAGPTGVVYGGYIRTFPFFPDCFAVSSRKLPVPPIRSADIPTASQAS